MEFPSEETLESVISEICSSSQTHQSCHTDVEECELCRFEAYMEKLCMSFKEDDHVPVLDSMIVENLQANPLVAIFPYQLVAVHVIRICHMAYLIGLKSGRRQNQNMDSFLEVT